MANKNNPVYAAAHIKMAIRLGRVPDPTCVWAAQRHEINQCVAWLLEQWPGLDSVLLRKHVRQDFQNLLEGKPTRYRWKKIEGVYRPSLV